jgi:hypothetical protein
MVVKRDITPMWSVATNGSAPAQSGLFVLAANLDIVPAQFDAFTELAKVNGAATPCRLSDGGVDLPYAPVQIGHVRRCNFLACLNLRLVIGNREARSA